MPREDDKQWNLLDAHVACLWCHKVDEIWMLYGAS